MFLIFFRTGSSAPWRRLAAGLDNGTSRAAWFTNKKTLAAGTKTVILTLVVSSLTLLIAGCDQSSNTAATKTSPSNPDSNSSDQSVTLSEAQLSSIKIAPAGTYLFPVEKEAVANISYDKIADPSAKILVANVNESDSPFFQVGQSVAAKVLAYPGRIFEGKITMLGGGVWDAGGNPAVDPNVHTVIARCQIDDPRNELYPGMLADVTIQVQAPTDSVSIPMNGVVRNGDGTMAVWITTDRKRFVQRIVKVGLQRDGQWQVLDGLQKGELAVTDGSVFLSNILFAPPSD